MGDTKIVQLLLVEDSPSDEHLLREAIAEILEAPHWPNWHNCELVHAADLYEALALLKDRRFDAVLLNLTLPDGDTLLGTFARVQLEARGAPLIILADEEDESLAHTLLREGAQDVLLKSILECAPLARALRYAIERQRRVAAINSRSFFDELTGLFNERGFAAFVEHDLQVARAKGVPLLVALLELTALPEETSSQNRDIRDLILIRASELLRTRFGEAAVVARVGAQHFGISTTTLGQAGIEQIVEMFERDFDSVNRARRRFPVQVRMGSATSDPQYEGGLTELLNQAASRLTPKLAMLAH